MTLELRARSCIGFRLGTSQASQVFAAPETQIAHTITRFNLMSGRTLHILTGKHANKQRLKVGTCLRTHRVDSGEGAGHPAASPHQLSVQGPVLHSAFWPLEHHIRTVQPHMSGLHEETAQVRKWRNKMEEWCEDQPWAPSSWDW